MQGEKWNELRQGCSGAAICDEQGVDRKYKPPVPEILEISPAPEPG
jgi:hypothetical protein